MIPPTLDQFALKHGTDKSSLNHGYTRWYERLFASIRFQHLNFVEIGIWEGASLQMWREYFPHATITGVDKSDRGIQVKDVNVVISGQDHPSLPELLPKPIDILIDDASHINALTIKTFQNLWPEISSGGMYIIEDLQTSYDSTHYDGDPNPDTTNPTAMQFCKRMADELNQSDFPQEYRRGYTDIESVHFYPNMCVIRKNHVGGRR